MEEERKPLTLFELAKKGLEYYKEQKARQENVKLEQEKKEVEQLRKTLENLKVEKETESEKQSLLSQISYLQKEIEEKKIKEVVT